MPKLHKDSFFLYSSFNSFANFKLFLNPSKADEKL